jgi:hypothetical protein
MLDRHPVQMLALNRCSKLVSDSCVLWDMQLYRFGMHESAVLPYTGKDKGMMFWLKWVLRHFDSYVG